MKALYKGEHYVNVPEEQEAYYESKGVWTKSWRLDFDGFCAELKITLDGVSWHTVYELDLTSQIDADPDTDLSPRMLEDVFWNNFPFQKHLRNPDSHPVDEVSALRRVWLPEKIALIEKLYNDAPGWGEESIFPHYYKGLR